MILFRWIGLHNQDARTNKMSWRLTKTKNIFMGHMMFLNWQICEEAARFYLFGLNYLKFNERCSQLPKKFLISENFQKKKIGETKKTNWFCSVASPRKVNFQFSQYLTATVPIVIERIAKILTKMHNCAWWINSSPFWNLLQRKLMKFSPLKSQLKSLPFKWIWRKFLALLKEKPKLPKN